MRILFDHQVFSWQSYGGISRYFAEQLRGLKALGQEAMLPDGFFSENVYLREFPEFNRQSLTSFHFKGKKPLQNLLGRHASTKAIRSKNPDVFHPTYFDTYFLKTIENRGVPFVLTVHDMIHELYGHGQRCLFSLDAQVIKNKPILAKKSAAIIAVSENTRRDLLHYYPEIDPAKIHVIYHGNSVASDSLTLSETITQSETITLPYLLFVGQRKFYKNFSWMVKQIADLLHSEKDLHLLCVGGSGFDSFETGLFKQLGISHKVLYKTVRSDLELANVYRKALCFIFPSQYEGFGIPVLEAFACGCPVVLNRAS